MTKLLFLTQSCRMVLLDSLIHFDDLWQSQKMHSYLLFLSDEPCCLNNNKERMQKSRQPYPLCRPLLSNHYANKHNGSLLLLFDNNVPTAQRNTDNKPSQYYECQHWHKSIRLIHYEREHRQHQPWLITRHSTIACTIGVTKSYDSYRPCALYYHSLVVYPSSNKQLKNERPNWHEYKHIPLYSTSTITTRATVPLKKASHVHIHTKPSDCFFTSTHFHLYINKPPIKATHWHTRRTRWLTEAQPYHPPTSHHIHPFFFPIFRPSVLSSIRPATKKREKKEKSREE
jgi:hypothetical protein